MQETKVKTSNKKTVQAELWHEAALKWIQVALAFKVKGDIDYMMFACEQAEKAFDNEDKLRIQLAQKSGRIAKA